MKKLMRYAALAAAFLLAATAPADAKKKKDSGKTTAVHAVNNLSHYYNFHADWGFPRQYMRYSPDKYIKSWCCIYNMDLSNANQLFLWDCDDRLPYVDRDYATIDSFLADGGGLMLLSGGNSQEQNKLASRYGAQFVTGLEMPVTAVNFKVADSVEIKRHGRAHLQLDKPSQWTVVVQDAAGEPVLAYKKEKKGYVLLGSRALLADNTDNRNDTINRTMWEAVWRTTASGKAIDTASDFDNEYIDKVENNVVADGIDLTYNDYLAPYADAMLDVIARSKPVIEARMGVPLSPGMGSKVVLIPTGGGGYSAGEVIALAIWWGDFPKQEDSMIEFVTHESVHSWVLPFAEIWNEPIATYVGNLVMIDMGHKEEAERRIAACIDRARKADPNLDLYDMRGKSCKEGVEDLPRDKVNDLHWGKAFWIWEQMRAENPDVVADYFQAKRKYAGKDQVTKYDDNNTVAVMSIAMGRDMFPWFRSIGFDVDREKAEVKF